jgi:drug/metabolite transporter (DMT)-like permease
VSGFTPTRLGVPLTLLAGVAFAIQPVFGQVALDGGASIASLLGWRYAIAAGVLAVVSRRRLRTIPPRVAALAFALGLALYAADSGLFYAALDRTSAPFATLLHYAHLVVVVGAVAVMGRERLDARRASALVGVLLGVALVGGGGSADVLGIGLALASAGAYSAYILVSDRLLRDVDPIAFASLLMAGAATSFVVFGVSTGDLFAIGGSIGIAAVLTGALVGSVFAVSAFLAGIRLVGPGTASLLVTVEVPVGLALAGIVLGEGLSAAQLAGAALVVGAIVLLQVRITLPRRRQLADVQLLPVSSSGGEPADALAA